MSTQTERGGDRGGGLARRESAHPGIGDGCSEFQHGNDNQATGLGRSGSGSAGGRTSDIRWTSFGTQQYANPGKQVPLDRGSFAGLSPPRTQSSASSRSVRSTDVNSRGSSPSLFPTNPDASGTTTARLREMSLQQSGAQGGPRPLSSSPTAVKRELDDSPEGGRPSKHLHSTRPPSQSDLSKLASDRAPSRRPTSGARQRARVTPVRQQQRLKSHRDSQSYISEQARDLQRDYYQNPRDGQLEQSAYVTSPPSPKPVALVQSPVHATQKLGQLVERHTGLPEPDTSSKPRRNVKEVRRSERTSELPHQRWKPLMRSSSGTEYSGMILQPDSSPISEVQLAAEVKGIYDGLVTVETKCIDIDTALAHDKTPLGMEQYQALIALHRTLLYEHHDFLMATQHPSASDELKGLATKNSMPARMWKHGIHAFLEVLRHRRPDSQDYMLAFVVLAYQMTALLYETVPCFTDTWIECLGDLARYRMAIEEDREIHALWGLVAARWYTMASDRHPDIGRLYHHLGILERPSLRKLASYAKSLTCVIPFINARDSMTTFCKPIVQEEYRSKAHTGSPEAALVTVYALVFVGSDANIIQSTAEAASRMLLEQPSTKIKEYGVPLAFTSVSALFEFGSQHNVLWQSFSDMISQNTRAARPSEIALPGSTNKTETTPFATTFAAAHVVDFYFACCNALTRPQDSKQSYADVLPSVHVILVWFFSIHSLVSRSNDSRIRHTASALMDSQRFYWGGLCNFLNGLCRYTQIHERVFEAARQGSFPVPREPEKFVPLAEDYWFRGPLWSQAYLPKNLLPPRTDEIESRQSPEARIERVQWLALHMAFRIEHIKYDVHRKLFWPARPSLPSKPQVEPVDLRDFTEPKSILAPSRTMTWATGSTHPASPTATSRSSTTMSTAESDSDGFTLVPRHKSKPQESWAKVAAAPPRKAREENKTVRVADPSVDIL